MVTMAARWWRANWGRLVGTIIGWLLLAAALLLAGSLLLGVFAAAVGMVQLLKWIVGF